MNEEEALQLFKEQINKIKELEHPPAYHPDYDIWENTTKKVLKILFDESYIKMFDNIFQDRFAMNAEHHYKLFLDVLNRKKQLLEGFVKEYERLKTQDISRISSTQLKNVNDIFDSLQIHPRIKSVCEELFKDGHYSQAIFEAFKAVNNFVKEKSGCLDLDGQKLMNTVFDENNPIIKINELKTSSDKDEQQGFRFIFMGSMTGIRNPKAHENIQQKDLIETLKYLALASLLVEKVDEETQTKHKFTNEEIEVGIFWCKNCGERLTKTICHACGFDINK